MSTYTIKQVAEEFQVSPSTVRNLVRSGKIKVLHLGKSVRITEQEMLRLKQDGMSPSTEATGSATSTIDLDQMNP